MAEKVKKKIKAGTIYIIVSVLFWLSCCGFYGYRLVHYYLQSKGNGKENMTLNERLTSIENLSLNNEGLTIYGNGYLYMGNPNDNYVEYSGLLWRVIEIKEDGSIVLVTDDTLNLMPFNATEKNDYLTSTIHSYLNPVDGDETSGVFYQMLDNPETYLVKGTYTYDKLATYSEILENKEVCNEYVGLVNINQYVLSGGANSYMNNGTYFWSMTGVKDSTGVYYVTPNGAIDTKAFKLSSANSYGVRPVVTLKAGLKVAKGAGYKKNPYVIDLNESTALNQQDVSKYVDFAGQSWRIISTGENGTKLIMNDVIRDQEGKAITCKFGKTTYTENCAVANYLVNTYLPTLDNREYLVEGEFYAGAYCSDTKYSVSATKELVIKSKIGLPSIYDLFSVNNLEIEESYWLANYQQILNRTIWVMQPKGHLMQDFYYAEYAIRPVIYLSSKVIITEGAGTYKAPYQITMGE